ncbi:MAG: LacI family DNA-binding transcriptional regulator [Velocimicrobium sp.]
MGITTKQLAQLCDVSRTTIHRALHDTGRINPETKEMILHMAKEYDYQPDLLARGLVKGKTYNIGVVVLGVDNRYFSQVLDSILYEANKKAYSVNINLHCNNKEIEKEQISRLASYRVDGIILSSVNEGDAYVNFLKSLNIPIVTIDNRIAQGIPFVGIDNEKITEMATDVILEKEYERIIFVCPPLQNKEAENIYVHKKRTKGFLSTVEKHKEIESIVFDNWNYKQQALEVLERSNKKTAFFCSGDMIALDLIEYLKDHDKFIVEDYGIMGYDNIDFLRYLSPRLSTIDNCAQEVAKEAVSMLLDLMNQSKTETNRIIKSELIKGETI